MDISSNIIQYCSPCGVRAIKELAEETPKLAIE